jgi:hypothetical protein
MKFFIPELVGAGQQGEELYQAIRKFVPGRFPLGDRRIRSITFRDASLGRKKGRTQTQTATVGREDPHGEGLVFAILESTKYRNSYGDPPSEGYLICAKNRGVKRGEPLAIPNADVQDVEFFDPE